MLELEPTNEGHIRRIIEEETTQLELGKVTNVFEHTDPDDESNHEVNVKLRDSDKEHRRVPVAITPFIGGIAVPEEGDTVLVSFLGGRGESPIVIGSIHNDIDRAPLGKEGIYRLRKGNLYFEIHPDGDWIRVAKKSSDDGTPSSKIEIKDDGSESLTVKCDGNINIQCSGDITLDVGGNTSIGTSGDPVARKGDTVEVTDSNGNTYTGQITSGSSTVTSE